LALSGLGFRPRKRVRVTSFFEAPKKEVTKKERRLDLSSTVIWGLFAFGLWAPTHRWASILFWKCGSPAFHRQAIRSELGKYADALLTLHEPELPRRAEQARSPANQPALSVESKLKAHFFW